MDNQREQEQAETRIAIFVPGIDVQLSDNENSIDQRQEEGVESTSSQIDKIYYGIKTAKDQKRGKFGRQAQIFHSIVQARWTASIINKQVNEQSSESNGLDKRNVSNEEVSDRAILVDEPAGEQQTKDDRQEIEPDNNIDGRVNFRIRSECDQEQYQNQKNLRAVGSGYGEFQLARDINDIRSSISVERKYQPIGIQLSNDRNRQYNSVFLNSKCKGKISFEVCNRFDHINRRVKWIDINIKTYRWQIEQGSGRVIKVTDSRGLLNKEGGIREYIEGLISRDNIGFIRSKKQCQTQEILYIGEGQKSGKTRFNENLQRGRICINIPANTNNKQNRKENNRGERLRNNYSTLLAVVDLVDAVKGNNSEREGVGRKREGVRDGIEDEKEESVSSSRDDMAF
ncbi:MAG: hypothetical protein EZS28_047957, partial [Streblomastix strix]